MVRRPRRVCYQRELIEAIARFLPSQTFSREGSHGNTTWKPLRLAWFAMLMSWDEGVTLGDRLANVGHLVSSLGLREAIGRSLAGYVNALVRETPQMTDRMRTRLQQPIRDWQEYWEVDGRLIFAVDGSRFESPRTQANEAGLGCAGRNKTTPQIFQTTLQHVGTALPWDFRLGPGTASERAHLDEMLPGLPSHALLTADAGFISYDLCLYLVQHTQALLLRVGANVHLLTELGFACEVKGETVYLWPEKRRDQPPIVLRLIALKKPGKRPIYLVTNLRDSADFTDASAGRVYRLRWKIETYYRSIKQTLGHRKLLSRRPAAAYAEQTWLVFGAWMLHLLTAEALVQAGISPSRWSCAKARTEVRRTMRGINCGQPLRCRLARAEVDSYDRKKPKQTRPGISKKKEKPPGAPKTRPAKSSERQRAQRFHQASYPRL